MDESIEGCRQSQLDNLIEHHTRTLATIEYKIEHSTTRIQRNSPEHEQATNIIRITDNIGDKYTERHLVKNTRSHNNNGQKQIKRLGTNRTTSTITNANGSTNNATITRRLFHADTYTTQQQEQHNIIDNNHNTIQ